MKSESRPIDFDNLQSKTIKLTKSHLWLLNRDPNIWFDTFPTAAGKCMYLLIKLRQLNRFIDYANNNNEKSSPINKEMLYSMFLQTQILSRIWAFTA